MRKRDIVYKVAKETGLTQHQTLNVIQGFLETVKEELLKGETIELRNFGVFEVVTQKQRVGRNPNKPENEVIIPAHKRVKFKTGKNIKEELDKQKCQKISLREW